MKKVALLLIIAFIGGGKVVFGQMNAQYYHNPYLLNPALAGADLGWTAYLGYSHQTGSGKDAGDTQALTASFRSGKTGLAIAGLQDRQGLIALQRFRGAYAYHLPLDGQNRFLHFGISFGILRERINDANIRGDIGDPVVARFNEQRNYLDGGAGIAYTDSRFNVQVSVPELNNQLNGMMRDRIGTATFLSAIGYRFNVDRAAAGLTVEPKVFYRSFSGMPAHIDAALSLCLQNKFTLNGIYHSSSRFTVGFSSVLANHFSAMLFYSKGFKTLDFYGERLEIGVKYKMRPNFSE